MSRALSTQWKEPRPLEPHAKRQRRSKTAYQLFKADCSPTFFEKNPDVKKRDFGVVSKAMCTQWNQLEQVEKQKYADRAARLKSETNFYMAD